MELTLRSFLLFLRKLVSFFRQKWDQSARRLWYIFGFLRSRILSRRSKRNEIRPSIERRPPKPSTTVVCASRLPPSSRIVTHGTSRAPPSSQLTPIPGGDTPIASPAPIPIQVRHPTIRSDTIDETHENYSHEHLDVNGYLLADSGPISRGPDPPTHHDEPESIQDVLHPHGDDHAPSNPVIPSLPASRPLSQYSYRPDSQRSAYRPPSQYSYRSHLSGAEAAARGYVPPSPVSSSPALSISVRPPSVAGSTTSQVYRASRPTTRVPRPSPVRSRSRRGAGSSTPASPCPSVHNALPEPPQPEPRTSEFIRRGRPSTAVSFGLASPPKDRLRPMIGIDRYAKHKAVVIEEKIHQHVSPPVTTRFVR